MNLETEAQRLLERIKMIQKDFPGQVNCRQTVFYANQKSTASPNWLIECYVTGTRYRLRAKKPVRVLVSTYTLWSRDRDYEHFLGRFVNIEE